MTPSHPPDPSRQARLEEVLAEYMRRLDRGEGVDREQLLARHPELAEELRSYFAGSDELGRLAGAPPAPTEPSRPAGAAGAPARSLGDYELLEPIGQGGMGVIYKARQRSLQRLVAVKMIRPDRLTSPADVLRFRAEAEAVASLDHPHVVPIYEVGEHQGRLYFSMKLIEGGSLSGHLPRLGSDLPAGVRLLAVVARAVHHAHQRGVLHRDLKPSNVLLDTRGQPHVSDFGLAKRLAPRPGEATLTERGMVVGTPGYMAPEQAASAGVSTASDVYSLGAILYEMLTGRPPFQADTPLDALVQLREREPTPPRSLNRRVDRDLETICLKCLRKEPPKRYASAALLAEDLERWLAGEPIQARPVGRVERALKWARRRPALAALAAALVLVFLGGFAGVSWQWRRAEGAYRKAVASAEAERQTAYARAVALAYAQWHAGNAGPAGRALEGCPPDLRGWEWHYLRRLFRARQLAALDARAPVRAVALSPDGTRIAAGGADGGVRVWDRRGLRRTFALRGHAGSVTAVCFSPDGKCLASGGADGAVRVWDASGGRVLARWRGHAAGVTGLAFDPAGRRLASTGEGEPPCGELKLWDPGTGKLLLGRAWHNVLAGVAFRPDGRRLATPAHDGVVLRWDASNLKPLGAFPVPNERTDLPWTSVAFSADGSRVAAGSPEGLVRAWADGTAQEFATPEQAGVSGVAFAGPGGRILAAACADNIVRGWYTRSGLPAFTLRGHTQPVTAVAGGPGGDCLASGSLDRTVRLWDLSRRDDDLTLRRANEAVTALAFHPDGRLLACASRDRALSVHEAATGKEVLTLPSLPGAVEGLSYAPGGRLLAGAGADGVIRLWDSSGRQARALARHRGPVHAVCFSPEGSRIASAGADGTVRLWDARTGRERLRLRGHSGAVRALAVGPGGGRLASAGEDGVVRVWDAAGGREGPVLAGHSGPVHAVAFSADGSRLASAGEDGVVRVWDASTGELAHALRGHAGAVRCLAYGPGGRLASAGEDRAVRLWDGAGRELLALRGHAGPVRCLAFSPGGDLLASAGEDRTVKVWDGTPLGEAGGPPE
jgi:eukaryotic-like serine/threonine-protein kinase